MHIFSLSKLNTSYGFPFHKFLIGRVRGQRNLGSQLRFEGQILDQLSSLSFRAVACYSYYQINKYSVDTTVLSTCCSLRRGPMAASGSKPVTGDVCVDSLIVGSGNALDLARPSAVFFGDRSGRGFRKGSINMRNRDVPFIHLSMSDLSPSMRCSRSFVGPYFRSLYTSCSASYSNGAAADVPFDISSRNEPLQNPSDSPGCKNLGQSTLKLLSASCYLPHPDKVKTGGEDAHFICEEEKVIGVADGVGGWADVGVDAGEYARQLMSNSVSAIHAEPKGLVDPAKVLEKAHASTKVIGSSTACIVALTNQGIRAINLGDSGFIVIREGSTVFRSPVQQYGFNFPYQLASGSGGDLPSSGQVFTFPVASGDVIVAGTDGLFDNLYDNEIAALVVQAVRAGLQPQAAARNIATLAQQRAQDRNRKTPFSAAAHDAGFRYVGGKLDDITVVVAYVMGANNQFLWNSREQWGKK